MRARYFLPAAAGAALFFSACGGNSYSSSSPGAAAGGTSSNASAAGSGQAATVAVASGSLGQFLVDGGGRTLYLFEADTGTTSTCAGPCLQAWPAVTTSGAPHAGNGAQAARLGTTRRDDGTMQVTYNGHPLYYFISDTKSGDITGEGITSFGAGWDVVSPAGNKIEKGGS
jgi:predicted lipoprotein with Yx(FWY)xxD motif